MVESEHGLLRYDVADGVSQIVDVGFGLLLKWADRAALPQGFGLAMLVTTSSHDRLHLVQQFVHTGVVRLVINDGNQLLRLFSDSLPH